MSNKSKQIIVLKLHTQKRVTGNENCTLSIWSYGNISKDFSEIMHLLSIIKPINHILVGSTIIIAHITLQKSLLPSFLSSDLKHIFCITNTRIWLIRIIIIQDSSSSRPQNRYSKKKNISIYLTRFWLCFSNKISTTLNDYLYFLFTVFFIKVVKIIFDNLKCYYVTKSEISKTLKASEFYSAQNWFF